MHPSAAGIWDAEAATFDEAADHGLRDPQVRAAWRDLLLPVVGSAPRRIADLGCGTGSLSVLLAESGHRVRGIDVSPEMIARARTKAVGLDPAPEFELGDAASPPWLEGSFDVVLSRHVLWAMPDPSAALARWVRLLAPGGVVVLIEGRWHTGVGLTTEETSALLREQGRTATVTPLTDAALWGGPIDDERYLCVGTRAFPTISVGHAITSEDVADGLDDE